MVPSQERRKQRSDIHQEAIALQLAATARRAGAQAMLLADRKGGLIAQSKAEVRDAKEIASCGPRLASIRGWVGTLRCSSGPRNVAISAFTLGADTAYICAVGLKSSRNLSSFMDLRRGARRILQR